MREKPNSSSIAVTEIAYILLTFWDQTAKLVSIWQSYWPVFSESQCTFRNMHTIMRT